MIWQLIASATQRRDSDSGRSQEKTALRLATNAWVKQPTPAIMMIGATVSAKTGTRKISDKVNGAANRMSTNPIDSQNSQCFCLDGFRTSFSSQTSAGAEYGFMLNA